MIKGIVLGDYALEELKQTIMGVPTPTGKQSEKQEQKEKPDPTTTDGKPPIDPALMVPILAENMKGSFAAFLAFKRRFHPVRIIKNGPATIVFWADGTKTVVKCGESEIPDDYTAFVAAVCKKLYGGTSRVKKTMWAAMEPEKDNKIGKS